LSQDETEGKVRQPQAPGRSDKHLARSLEDVSYLFLSEEAAESVSTGELRRDSKGQTHPQPGEQPPLVVLDRSPALQRDSLVAMLNSHTGVLEEGLGAIDANVPMDTGGPIDLVAVDQSNKLAIIDLDILGGDALLLRGICHFDWFVRNVPILRRMYHGRVIDFSAQPRLFLVAPEFSPMLRCAAQRIAGPPVKCFVYRVVAVPNGAGIFFTCIPPS
jgi:hypothetical protein